MAKSAKKEPVKIREALLFFRRYTDQSILLTARLEGHLVVLGLPKVSLPSDNNEIANTDAFVTKEVRKQAAYGALPLAVPIRKLYMNTTAYGPKDDWFKRNTKNFKLNPFQTVAYTPELHCYIESSQSTYPALPGGICYAEMPKGDIQQALEEWRVITGADHICPHTVTAFGIIRAVDPYSKSV